MISPEQALMGPALLALGLVAVWSINRGLDRLSQPRRPGVFDIDPRDPEDDGRAVVRRLVRFVTVVVAVVAVSLGLWALAIWAVVSWWRPVLEFVGGRGLAATVVIALLLWVVMRERRTGTPWMDDYVEPSRVDVLQPGDERLEVTS